MTLPSALLAKPLPDGLLLSTEPCPANEINNYDDYVASIRSQLDREKDAATEENIEMPTVSDSSLAATLVSEDDFEKRLAYRGFECREIVYASDGLQIAGYLWKPVNTSRKSFPLIIANRGGNTDFGAMTPWRRFGWYDFLEAGYVVLASQYRGGPGSEGEDRFGGDDVNDVLNLFPLAENLGYIDMDNVFMFGGSRGGMMTYLSIKHGAPINAAAVRAGAADLRALIDPAKGGRPAMAKLYEFLDPSYADDPDEFLTSRSAVEWPEKITRPVIFFHGTADWRVPASNTLDLAQKLDAAGRPYELHIYEDDNHAMTLNSRDMMARTLSFFEKHYKKTDDKD